MDKHNNIIITTKQCCLCREVKPVSQFYKESSRKDGLLPRCKSCHSFAMKCSRIKHANKIREKNRLYRNQNKERIIENSKKYYAAHADEINRRNSEYRASHIEARRSYEKKYRTENAQKIYEKDRRWIGMNREKTRATVHRYRARKRSLPHTFTSDDWEYALQYFNDCCAYCGVSLANKVICKEHYISACNGGGYTANNIVPACKSCNSSKSNHDPVQWCFQRFGEESHQIIKRIDNYFGQVVKALRNIGVLA